MAKDHYNKDVTDSTSSEIIRFRRSFFLPVTTTIFVFLSLMCFLADFVIKTIVESRLVLHQPLPLIDGVINLTLVHNTGSAFGMFRGMRWFLVAVTVIFLAVLIHRLYSRPIRCFDLAVVSMITGGALSNLYDRVFLGYVVDYIDLGWWPVFNLSDSFLNVGCALYIIKTLIREKYEAVGNSRQ
jgi:signal peptidase II